MKASEYQSLFTKGSSSKKKPAIKASTNKVQSELSEGIEGYETANSVINEIWLKPGSFPYVCDCVTHLEGFHKETGQWYRIDITKIDQPSK